MVFELQTADLVFARASQENSLVHVHDQCAGQPLCLFDGALLVYAPGQKSMQVHQGVLDEQRAGRTVLPQGLWKRTVAVVMV